MTTVPISHKYFVATATPPQEGDPSITITTINRDREGDSVLPEGGLFDTFRKNPVLFWAHGAADRYAAVPIGVVTGLNVEPGVGVKASFRFLENDPFAARIENAWNQNAIRASSIGFRSIQSKPNGQGMDHEQWELLELSLCAVPMNADCVRTLKSVGLTDEEASAPCEATELTGSATESPNENSELTAERVEAKDEALDQVKADLATIQAGFYAVQKQGRVLSAVNESRLRAAMDALANAGAVLTEVLAQLMPMQDEPAHDDPMQPADMPPKHPMPTMALDDAETYSLSLAEDAMDLGSGLRLVLADDPGDDGDVLFTLVDDAGREPVFSIDPNAMREAISDAVRAVLQRDLVGPVGESVQRALDRARGRVA